MTGSWDILLLDLAASGSWSRTLFDTIAGCADDRLRLHARSLSETDPKSQQEAVRTITLTAKPSLMLLALPSSAIPLAVEVVQSVQKVQLGLPIIAALEECRPDEAMELLGGGISDFVILPATSSNLLPRIWRLLGCLESEQPQCFHPMQIAGMRQLIGNSPKFLAAIANVPRMASCNANLLILGETGSGKELCAQAVHHLSRRGDKPLIPVNCGSIPVDLLENELFGHVTGAYTGASSHQIGLVGEAKGGTLFLDEVESLPPAAQVKLLRFLQDKRYRPLGSPKYLDADVRLIAASNVDLDLAVTRGTMRMDLYYRLNVLSLRLPPLRERGEDIPALARHFICKFTTEFQKPAQTLSPGAIQKLVLHTWPGNVRELEHVIERAVALTLGTVITEADIAFERSGQTISAAPFREAKARAVGEFEKNYIRGLLVASEGNITKAAQQAHKNRRAFWELVRKHEIDVPALRAVIKQN
jgi:two-component system, NtrC family, response regulator GlrR